MCGAAVRLFLADKRDKIIVGFYCYSFKTDFKKKFRKIIRISVLWEMILNLVNLTGDEQFPSVS